MTRLIKRGLLLAAASVVYLGALVGPFSSINQIYFLFALAFISLAFNTSRAVDEILVVGATILGLIPVFGWISIPVWFNPLQLIITAWFCVLAQNWKRKLDKPQAFLSMIPLTIAPIFSFQWWKGMSEGDPVSVLTRILPIWDLSGHFLAFYSNLVDNIYIPRKAPPSENLMWAYREYPTGIHYVWAQFAKSDKSRILESSELAIPIFTNSVVVTMVLSTLFVSFSIWRLSNAIYLRVAFSVICSGLAVALITLGPLSQTITTGFANIPPVIISISIFLSFSLKPHKNERVQLLILGGSVLCMSYNWYPTLLLVAPTMMFSLIRQLRQPKKWNVLVFLALVSPLVALPLFQTLTLGLSHIEEQGGVQPFPSGFLVTVLVVSAAGGLWASSVTKNKLFLTITLPAPVLGLVLALWLRVKTDTYPYYFHKAALFIAAYALFVLLFILAAIYGTQKSETSSVQLGQKIQIVLAATLMSFGLSQMFGYWGLDYTTYSGQGSAYGILNRNEFVRPNDLHKPTAALIINQAKTIKHDKMNEKSCSTLMIPSKIGVADRTSVFGWKGPLENIWFHALSDSLTTEAQQLAFMTATISQVANDYDLYIDGIKKTFHPPSTCVISSRDVNNELREYTSQWKSLKELTD